MDFRNSSISDISHYSEIPVSGIYSSTVGEGLHMGRPAMFIQFGECNLKCGWCDTNYSKYDMVKIGTITEACREAPPLIVFTGGEPLLAYNAIKYLCTQPEFTSREIHIETNGTIGPEYDYAKIFHHVILGFKIGSANVEGLERFHNWMEFLTEDGRGEWVELKFVVSNSSDLRLIAGLLQSIPRFVPIVIQPNDAIPPGTMGRIRDRQIEVLGKILDSRNMLGYTHDIRVLPRMQRLIYEGQKGF